MTLPTWQRLRETGWMVVDVSTLQLGVYPTENGMVTLLFQAPGVEPPHALWVGPEDVPLLIERLQQALRQAEEVRDSRLQSQSTQAAYDVIERAKRGD